MRIRFIYLIVFLVSFPAFSQNDDGRKVNNTIREVANNIYMLKGMGGNIGFSVGRDGVFMIDAQYAEATSEILKDIERIGKKPVRMLVNTHHHGDHTGGNHNIAEKGTIIFSQENARIRMEAIKKAAEESGQKVGSEFLPLVTFTNDLSFYYNEERINVFHISSAHTDGDAIIHFTESDVIHTGDAFVNGAYPFIDHKNGGTLNGYINGLTRIWEMANVNTKIIPGHGELASVNDVKYTQDMLMYLYKQISYHYTSGATEDQVVAMTELTRKYDEKGFGEGFITTEKIVRTIYKEVDAELGAKKRQRERDMKDLKEHQLKLDGNDGGGED